MNQECTSPAADTPTLPRISCASWCEDGTGHPGALFAGDQWCRTPSARVAASLVEPWPMGDGRTEPATASVYVSQDPGEAPHVAFVNAQDQGHNLTPGEARELAGLLVHFAWVAEQDQEKRNAVEIGYVLGRSGQEVEFTDRA